MCDDDYPFEYAFETDENRINKFTYDHYTHAFIIEFSDGSCLRMRSLCNTYEVMFFDWNDYPEFQYDYSTRTPTFDDRVKTIMQMRPFVDKFSVNIDATSGKMDGTDITIYIDTDNDKIPFFGFRSIHNGYYPESIYVNFTDKNNNVLYENEFYL